MPSRTVVSSFVAVTLGVALVATAQVLAQSSPDAMFQARRTYQPAPRVSDLSSVEKQQLSARLSAATVRHSASIMGLLERHGFTGIQASISPQDDKLILGLAGGTGAADSLPTEVQDALDGVARLLLSDFDDVVHLAGYVVMFNVMGNQ